MKPGSRWIVASAGTAYFLDQLTKWMVRQSYEVGQHRDLLPFFSLNHVENTGAAFGMGVGQNTFFIVTSVVVLGLLYWSSRHLPHHSWRSTLGQGLVWGGAVGNLTDRLVSGHVTDFLDFYIGSHHWPSFNVADSAITVGAVFLFLSTLF